MQKVFLRLRPEEPKLPSSGVRWAVLLLTRYPGVCRVYAHLMLVFVAHHIIPLKMPTNLRYKILGHSDLIENVLRYIDIAAMKK